MSRRDAHKCFLTHGDVDFVPDRQLYKHHYQYADPYRHQYRYQHPDEYADFDGDSYRDQ
jgi:hypothetical protein